VLRLTTSATPGVRAIPSLLKGRDQHDVDRGVIITLLPDMGDSAIRRKGEEVRVRNKQFLGTGENDVEGNKRR
jgi:hypothetical protein